MSDTFYSAGKKGAASEYFQKITQGLDRVMGQSNDVPGRVDYHPSRIPWIMSTTEWLEEGYGIIWHCNPSDISWNIRLRQATSKNANSTVTHNWPNSNRGTHFDEFVISMNLQSGNLMPYNRSQPATPDSRDSYETSPANPPGIVNFYDFLKLMDAPKITKNGRSNHVVIQYVSNIFPKLTLIGQFEPEGVRFNDTSQDPMSVNSWNVSFIVQDTSPRLSDNLRGTPKGNSVLLQEYFTNMFIRGQGFINK